MLQQGIKMKYEIYPLETLAPAVSRFGFGLLSKRVVDFE
jgi:hypothetical protein